MMEEEQRSDPDATIQTMLDGTASKHDAAADALRATPASPPAIMAAPLVLDDAADALKGSQGLLGSLEDGCPVLAASQ